MSTYDNYVVVIPATEAIQVANLLAALGMALEGLTLEVPEGDSYMFRITPQDIHAAWKAIHENLHENWLGVSST